jgi:membrane-associated phospholipid phosphatase
LATRESPLVSNSTDFTALLRRTIAAITVAAILVIVCYFFVDRPVAQFVHAHKNAELKWLTLPPPIVQAWSPAVIALLVVVRAFRPFRRWEVTLLAACISMIVADQFRESLAVVFGRYWPDTWIDNNPSLIGDGAYGFHWFHEGSAYGSFPSGHLARTVGIAAVVWISYPRLRWLCVLLSLAVAVGMVGMNYHFVGDVIGGSFVGGIVGAYTAQFCGLAPFISFAKERMPQ